MDTTKPECKLTETDGNVFAIIARVRRTLINADMRDDAEEFATRAMGAPSYDAVLRLCFEYVDVSYSQMNPGACPWAEGA